MIWLPELQVHNSELLCAALDDRYFRLWELFEDGTLEGREGLLQAEARALVVAIQANNTDETLRATAEADGRLMGGSTHRGPVKFDWDRDGSTVVAWRQLELVIYAQVQRLDEQSLFEPSREGRAYKEVPGLFAKLDKRQLLPLDVENVDPVHSSVPSVLFGGHALSTHPHLRPNRELVHDLLGHVGSDERQVRIALDPNAVVPAAERKHVLLLDHWYGVKVDAESLDDPNSLGRARHERVVDKQDFGLMPLLAIDVSWSLQDDLKVLEVTETVPAPAPEAGQHYVTNRYLHALRDYRNRRWVHVDGAVKAHEAAGYHATQQMTSGSKGPVVAYRKLWRLDGVIPDENFGRLLGHHFRDNELVIEYFGEPLDDRVAG